MKIEQHSLDELEWGDVRILIDDCYPNPPRDVFEKIIKGTFRQRRVWCAWSDGKLVGLIMLSPHSKGGHIENLCVIDKKRNQGVGKALVDTLIKDTLSCGPMMLSLTTRIPRYFEYYGFVKCGELSDGSVCMVFVSCAKY